MYSTDGKYGLDDIRSDLVSITSTFYSQILRLHISKSVKIQSSCQYLFALLRSLRIKALSKMLLKSTPDVADHGLRRKSSDQRRRKCCRRGA
jgi:hypothetical protein